MSADENEERRQLSDIRDQVQRASKRMSLQTPAMKQQREDILRKLIALVHSPYSSLKSFAANNIKVFIKEFEDLQDDAINAVYDLCEDQDPRVRKDGYRAITQVSREQKKWVKRNADVLVQLLQSDEPEEVEVVEHQLTEHLDMDPQVTLVVLCDQIVPVEEAVDEEDQAIRDHLRALVLNFMVGRAKRAIVERHAETAENVFSEGLMKTMFRLPPGDIDMIVKDIFLSLPSFGRYSNRGEALLEIILSEAKSSVKSELSSSDELSSQTKTQRYLSLARFLAIEKRVARPTSLLQFYCQNFSTKASQARCTEAMRVFVIENFANALSSLQENAPKMVTPTPEEVARLRNQVVDVCPVLLTSFTELSDEVDKPWPASKILVQAIARRKSESKWNVPLFLTTVLVKLKDQAEMHQDDKHVTQEVINLIRSLVAQPDKPKSKASPQPPQASSTNIVGAKGTANNKLNGGAVQIKRKREQSDSQRRSGTPSKQPPGNQTNRSTPDHTREGSRGQRRSQTTPGTGPSSRATSITDQEPSTRRKKGGESAGPSLLSRLTLADGSQPSLSSIPAKRRAEPDNTPSKRANVKFDEVGIPPGGYTIRGADYALRAGLPLEELAPPAGGGLSIKGAARRQPPPHESQTYPDEEPGWRFGGKRQEEKD
ncbi:hypothetical protein EIP86_000995 [Pleurotus ostreatoroseus]|nr:hypothetical protein EIP86_000995 [Pleurotus ostreatoroseus]